MKNRLPIKRSPVQNLCSVSDHFRNNDTPDDEGWEDGQEAWDYYEEHREEWEASEPAQDEQTGYENWIPFKLIPNALFDEQDDEEVKVISWDNGILISHIPMLHTMERLFFSQLVQLDLDEGLNFCTTIAENVEPDLKKKFLIKLIEEISIRSVGLQSLVNDHEKACDKSWYGVTNLIAFCKLDNIRDYLINKLAACGDPLPIPSFPKLNRNTIQKSERKFQNKLPIKDILMWANILFIIGKPPLKDGYTKAHFFKLIGEGFDIEIPNNPDVNINLSIGKGSYHDYLNELIQFIHRYEEAFNLKQEANTIKNPNRMKHKSMIKWEKST